MLIVTKLQSQLTTKQKCRIKNFSNNFFHLYPAVTQTYNEIQTLK